MNDFEQLQPLDSHNRRLQANVHPLDYTNPVPDGKYNMVVIGAGTAGLVAASVAAGLGGKVALIERALMGGDCLNVGCVPSKAVVSAARSVAAVKKAGAFGVKVSGDVRVDFPKIMERMRKLRSDISPADSVQRFKEKGVDVFLGQARFTGSNTVEVDGKELTFVKAVIATGARASAPPIPGLDDTGYLTNETLFSLTELPKRFGVIGAGPVGCEMAQSFARFGSQVYLVESTGGILPKEDRDAANIVKEQMIRDGVTVFSNGRDLKISKGGVGTIRMHLESEGQSREVEVDQLLVAVGRAPNVEGLGLKTAGVGFSDKGVTINDRFQTTNRDIYAAGDVCSRWKFTHAADFMARAVVRNALFKGRAKHSALIVPWTTYTSPEIAHVGLNEDTAREKGVEIDTFAQPMAEVDRAILEGETDGFVKVHVKKGSDEIVGATVVAPNAGDIIGGISLAMTQKTGLGSIANAIHPYPTQAEAVRKTGDLYNRTRLTPFVAKLFKKWLAWQRR